MPLPKRTLLVVEDNPDANKQYAIYCRKALRELFPELSTEVSLEDMVKQAFSYDEAEAVLAKQPVDFISIDLALSKEEEHLAEAEQQTTELGGMNLLRKLQGAKKRPISVVLTGVTSQSLATETLQQYDILAFYQKDRFDDSKYTNAIKAALWYLDAAELVAEPDTELDIEAAEKIWRRALKAADMAGIKERAFPGHIVTRIKSIRNELTDSVTGLPTDRWTEKKLNSKVVGRERWALIRLTVRGFSEFVSAFASQEEPILRFVAGLLKKARNEFQDQDLFIGHLGHHNYISDPNFIVIPGKASIDHVADMARWVESEFKKVGAELFTSKLESTAHERAPALAIEAKVMTGGEYTFPDLQLLLDTLGSS